MTKITLQKLFVEAGLDPFDAFLLDPADWPKHIRAWYEAQPAPATAINPDPRDPSEWAAMSGKDGAE